MPWSLGWLLVRAWQICSGDHRPRRAVLDEVAQRALAHQLAFLRPGPARGGDPVGHVGEVADSPRVVPQLARDGAGRAPQGASDGPQRLAGGAQIAYPFPLGERQETRVQLLLKGLETHRPHRCLHDHTGHRDGSRRVVHTSAVGVGPPVAGLPDAVVPVLGGAWIHPNLLGSFPARDAPGPQLHVLLAPRVSQVPVVHACLAGQRERRIQVQPQLTGHGRHSPHDIQPLKETPLQRRIKPLPAHGPRNSH
ncbi:hypothetical protein ACVWXU_000293 [Streptomyces sp. TE33382]